MPDDDRERVVRLLALKESAWDRLASFILDAYCDPAHVLASLDDARARLGSDLPLRSVEEALAMARGLADSALGSHGHR